MYGIMVVEDSKPIMRNIISQIESCNMNLKIVATAFNGKEAINILKDVHIDILITDIKMPKMDGLALIQEAKKILPSLKCIIISGYNDFEYARQAIKLQIAEYLLKPVDSTELKEILHKTVDSINRESNEKRGNILNDLLNGLELKNSNSFELSNYSIILVRYCLLRKGLNITIKNKIEDFIEELHLNKNSINVIDTKYPSEKVIIVDILYNKEFEIMSLANLMMDKLKNDYPQVNMVVSSTKNDITKLSEEFEKLSGILSSLIILDRPQIIYENSLHNNADIRKMHTETEKLGIKFHFLVKNDQKESFKNELGRNFVEWEKNQYPVIFIKRFLTVILDKFYEINKEAYDKTNFNNTSSKIDDVLTRSATYSELLNNSLQLFEQLFLQAKIDKKGAGDELFERIDSFLKLNIYDNITMQELSVKFNVSPSYITRIIKKYCQISPIEYYMKLKIIEAKRLLDSNEQILVKDVADVLSFSDQHYFSKVFKSYIGCSPTDYKKSLSIHIT